MNELNNQSRKLLQLNIWCLIDKQNCQGELKKLHENLLKLKQRKGSQLKLSVTQQIHLTNRTGLSFSHVTYNGFEMIFFKILFFIFINYFVVLKLKNIY